MEWELATLKMADGTPVERTAARRSLAKLRLAVQAAGGRVPNGRDGRPMLWSEQRGWFERGADDETRPSGRPLSYFTRRQRFRKYQIRQQRRDWEIAFERDLVRTATPLAWFHAKSFRHGFLPRPHVDSPAEVLIGWRLHRRGMYDPPASL